MKEINLPTTIARKYLYLVKASQTSQTISLVSGNFGKHMEVTVKLRKMYMITNTWGMTNTKTDKDNKVEIKRIAVKFSRRHLATIF